MAGLVASQRIMEHLDLDIRQASWLEPDGIIITLLALSLKTLSLWTSHIMCFSRNSGSKTTWMLAPLQNATHREWVSLEIP